MTTAIADGAVRPSMTAADSIAVKRVKILRMIQEKDFTRRRTPRRTQQEESDGEISQEACSD